MQTQLFFVCLSIERHAFAGDCLPELGPRSIINGFINDLAMALTLTMALALALALAFDSQ